MIDLSSPGPSAPGIRAGGGAATPPATGMPPRPLDARLLATPVLIVEDEAVIAWTLESHLEDMGFADVTIAPDADAAIAAASAHPPGLIVSDINLGGGSDGVAAAAAIHTAGFVPTLFVTGYASPDARARIERDVPGASVLRKPIQADELRTAVAEALDGGAVN